MTSYSYVLFYKPYNVLSQFTDDSPHRSERQTLQDYIPIPEVYPVGRLDLDSEGLLLLTNDSALKHRLTEPQFAHPRTYWVQVEHIPDEQALAQLQTGVLIKGKKTRLAIARLLPQAPDVPCRQPPIRTRQHIPTAWLELTLTEGRNRQVRRMTAAVGYPTLRLIRVSIGDRPKLTLAGLEPGQWRHLTAAEIQQLRALVSPRRQGSSRPQARAMHRKARRKGSKK